MINPFQKLDDKLFAKKKTEQSPLSSLFDVAREFSCLGEILGREFEIKDPEGNLLYKVSQKPIDVVTLKTLINELGILRKLESEAAKGKTNKPVNLKKK